MATHFANVYIKPAGADGIVMYMNAFWIKVIAIVAMLVDHFALMAYPDSLPLQIIGRLSFILIAWLIANGAHYTGNIEKYFWRVGIFAVLAQIPYEIGFYLVGRHPIFLNVLFTLFLGLLAIRFLRLDTNHYVKLGGVAVSIFLAGVLNADYGAGGVLSIVAFYVFFNRPYLMVASQIFIHAILTNLSFFIAPGFGNEFVMHPLEEYAILALPIILLYNKARGFATGLFFYWFFVIQSFAALILSRWL